MTRRHRLALEDRSAELIAEGMDSRAADTLAYEEYYAEMESRGDLARDEGRS